MDRRSREIINDRVVKSLELYRTGIVLDTQVPLKVSAIERRGDDIIIACPLLDTFIIFDGQSFKDKLKGIK